MIKIKRIIKTLILMPGLLLLHWLSFCSANKAIVEIGETKVTQLDISYKIDIAEIYQNKRINEESAVIQLVNKILEYEVAKMHGITVTPEEIESFSSFVDSSTRAPELLAKIKEIFKGDQSEYGRVYLLPIINNRKLHAWYNRNAEIHKKEGALIKQAHNLVTSGKTFKQAAEICSLKYVTYTDSGLTDMQLPPGLPPPPGASENPMAPIYESLAEGELYKDIIEDEYTYKVIRLLKKKGTIYTVDMIYTPKRLFPDWFQEQASKIPIVFHNQELKDSLIEQFQKVWWVKTLSEQ